MSEAGGAIPARIEPKAPLRRQRSNWVHFLKSALIGGGMLLLLVAIGLAGTGFTWRPYPGSPESRGLLEAGEPSRPGSGSGPGGVAVAGLSGGAPESKQERAERRKLERQLHRLAPGGVYIVVDSANNRLWVRQGDAILLEAVVSTGSGLVLRQVDADRTWTFDTPRGMYRIHRRAENPVWVKPDWAFLEDGEPVPSRQKERFDYGALGEYGLYFGDAYLIHGTLYENLLGRSVSHGCIRVGREDLRRIWKLCPLGTPVILF